MNNSFNINPQKNLFGQQPNTINSTLGGSTMNQTQNTFGMNTLGSPNAGLFTAQKPNNTFGSPAVGTFGSLGSANSNMASSMGASNTNSLFNKATAFNGPSNANQSATTTGFNFGQQNTGFGSTPINNSTFGSGSNTGSPSLFGNSNQTQQKSLFGVNSTNPQPAAFGNISVTSQQSFNNADSNSFGKVTQNSSFGGNVAFGTAGTVTPSFGNNTTTTTLFGQSAASPFGNTAANSSTSLFGTPQGSTFGNSSTNTSVPAFNPTNAQINTAFGQSSITAFGGATTNTAVNAFGSSSASTFGSSNANPSFGQTGNTAFGGVTNNSFGAPTNSPFGGSLANPTMGQSAPTNFGGSLSNSTMGQPAASPFSGSVFGQTPASTFGGSTVNSLNSSFGQTAAPSFGSTVANTAVSAFGTSPAPAFGSQQTNPSFAKSTATTVPSLTPSTGFLFGNSLANSGTSFGSSPANPTTRNNAPLNSAIPSFGTGNLATNLSFGQAQSTTNPTLGQTTSSFDTLSKNPSIPSFGQTGASPFGMSTPSTTFGTAATPGAGFANSTLSASSVASFNPATSAPSFSTTFGQGATSGGVPLMLGTQPSTIAASANASSMFGTPQSTTAVSNASSMFGTPQSTTAPIFGAATLLAPVATTPLSVTTLTSTASPLISLPVTVANTAQSSLTSFGDLGNGSSASKQAFSLGPSSAPFSINSSSTASSTCLSTTVSSIGFSGTPVTTTSSVLGTLTAPFSGLGGTASSKPSFTSPLAVSSTTAKKGLGGSPISKTIGSVQTKDLVQKDSGIKQIKDTELPVELKETVESFKKFVIEQKKLREDIVKSHDALNLMVRVDEECQTLGQSISEVANGLLKIQSQCSRTKNKVMKEYTNVKIAQTNADPSFGLYGGVSESASYFATKARECENRAGLYLQEIEVVESLLNSTNSSKSMTTKELVGIIKNMDDEFIGLAAKLYIVHERIKTAKIDYLRRIKPGSGVPNPFVAIEGRYGDSVANNSDSTRRISTSRNKLSTIKLNECIGSSPFDSCYTPKSNTTQMMAQQTKPVLFGFNNDQSIPTTFNKPASLSLPFANNPTSLSFNRPTSLFSTDGGSNKKRR